MGTNIHSRAGFRKVVGALAGVTLHEQWEALVAKVGGKVFALHGDADGAIVLKVSALAFEGLTTLDGVRQAAYFAKGQWVHIDKGAEISEADLRAYLGEAHRIIAAKLTRKMRAELGIDVPTANAAAPRTP